MCGRYSRDGEWGVAIYICVMRLKIDLTSDAPHGNKKKQKKKRIISSGCSAVSRRAAWRCVSLSLSLSHSYAAFMPYVNMNSAMCEIKKKKTKISS